MPLTSKELGIPPVVYLKTGGGPAHAPYKPSFSPEINWPGGSISITARFTGDIPHVTFVRNRGQVSR